MSLHKMLRAAAGYQAPAPANTDPQFNYVSMLLHGDGTNGSQNNTFVDSSTNNFTITRNGNTTQGSLSPYGSLWSNYFDRAAASYLSVADNAALNMGTSDFTIEAWIYITGAAVTDAYFINKDGKNTVSWAQYGLYIDANLKVNASLSAVPSVGAGPQALITSSSSVSVNTWVHVALTRVGTSATLWVNGASAGTSSSVPSNLTNGARPLLVGYENRGTYDSNFAFNGYVSNVRIVKGTALYTSNFTPPTAPLTAITNTALLTCQSNRFIDNSANNFTITRNGDVRVIKDSPFLPTAAYSTSTIGGSGYFDGNGDYVAGAASTALALPGAFTFECWFYPNSFDQTFSIGDTIFSCVSAGSLTIARTSTGAGNAWGIAETGVAWRLTSTTLPTNNAWNHMVAVRDASNNTALFLNGVRVASTTLTTNFGQNGFTVGSDNGSANSFLDGYLSNVRLVKGTAVYSPSSTTLTVPTAPLTAITNTSLLLNFTNAGIFDNAAENDLETVGNAQISTSVKKYGTGSLAFDGTGDWLLVPDNTNLQLGSGSFTVEGWVNLALLGSARGLVSKGTSTTGWSLSVNSLNQVVFTDATTAITTTTALMANTWYHVAVVRVGTGTNQTVIYINGVSSATGTSASNFTETNPMYIGADRTGGSALNGYIDDLRITKGFARYTAAFTPPTAAFPDQ